MRRQLLLPVTVLVLAVLSVHALAAPNETPEKTLQCYFESLWRGDRTIYEECVDVTQMEAVDISGPIPRWQYTINKKLSLGPGEVRKAAKGWGPKSPVRVGDVELQVKQFPGFPMVSYYLRQRGGLWKIYLVVPWGDS